MCCPLPVFFPGVRIPEVGDCSAICAWAELRNWKERQENSWRYRCKCNPTGRQVSSLGTGVIGGAELKDKSKKRKSENNPQNGFFFFSYCVCRNTSWCAFFINKHPTIKEYLVSFISSNVNNPKFWLTACTEVFIRLLSLFRKIRLHSSSTFLVLL